MGQGHAVALTDNRYDSVFTQNTYNFNLLAFVDFIEFIPLFFWGLKCLTAVCVKN